MKIALADIFIRYSPTDAHEGPLGGTETSFIFLAEALQSRGHEVHVYLLDPGLSCFREVRYHRINEFGRLPVDVIIARWPQLFESVGHRFRKRIWWCHKAVDVESVAAAQTYRVYPVVTSRFQAEQLADFGWRGGFDVVPLGCRFLDFPEGNYERNPFSAVWTTAIDRGLSHMIDIWRRLRRHLPRQSKLVIAGGPAVYGDFGDSMKTTEELLKEETAREADIEWVGPLAPTELFELLLTCGFMPYTASIPESFSVAVLEAQAAGCLPIVTPRGALKERVADGRTGWIAPMHQVGSRILQYMKRAQDGDVEHMRLEAQRTARQFTWERAARCFETALAHCFAMTL